MRYFLGIDPGVKTGFAVWDSKNKVFHNYGETDFWGMVDFLYSCIERNDITVVIEDPNQNKPVFDKDTPENIFDRNKARRTREKIAQNIGSNKREASLLIEYCQLKEIPCISVKPTTKKWDKALFKAATKITEEVSQHTRDAAKLVVGRI